MTKLITSVESRISELFNYAKIFGITGRFAEVMADRIKLLFSDVFTGSDLQSCAVHPWTNRKMRAFLYDAISPKVHSRFQLFFFDL